LKFSIRNTSNLNLNEIKPFLSSFLPFAKQKMGFDKPVSINFVSDPQNSSQVLGKTAFYDPNNFSVTIYTDRRHPKDIMRSLSHELVHHSQNCRGAFDHKPSYGEGYFHQDEYMREMEREAYEKGNMCFRSWEETYKKQLKESIYYKTGETQMNLKEWKDKELFDRLMEGYGYRKPMEEDEIDEAHCNEGELGEAHCNEGELGEAHCNESELEEGKGGTCPECKNAKRDCVCPKNEEVLDEEAKPDFLDLDKDGDKEEPMKKAAKEKMDENLLRKMVKEAISKALAKRK
jgi:hypothetical protein|tara:strand:- start:154 stop:1020 length:867 start_codon:yes stop_codon:yes gene_type:complete